MLGRENIPNTPEEVVSRGQDKVRGHFFPIKGEARIVG